MAYRDTVITDPTAIGDARNRILYQSEALGVSKPGGSPAFLRRVQSVNYSFSVGRTDVNQFGELAAIDRVILEQPTVTMDFSYILHGLENEKALGFDTGNSDVGMISEIIKGASATTVVDKLQYHISLANEGLDAATADSASVASNINIPDGFITSYSASGSVGEFPTATVNLEALDMRIGSAHTANTESVAAQAASAEANVNSYVLRPGEIELDIKAFGGIVHLQSFTLTVDLTREPINRLGTNFPFARVISFPLNATLSAEGILSKDSTDGDNSLGELVSSDAAIESLVVDCRAQTGTNQIGGIKYTMKQAKLDSYSYTSSIGANKAVSMDWSVPIGSSTQTDRGVFIAAGGQASN
jgi:hypothetical protein